MKKDTVIFVLYIFTLFVAGFTITFPKPSMQAFTLLLFIYTNFMSTCWKDKQ